MLAASLIASSLRIPCSIAHITSLMMFSIFFPSRPVACPVALCGAWCLGVIVLYYIDLVLSSLFIIFFMIFYVVQDGALYQEFLHI